MPKRNFCAEVIQEHGKRVAFHATDRANAMDLVEMRMRREWLTSIFSFGRILWNAMRIIHHH